SIQLYFESRHFFTQPGALLTLLLQKRYEQGRDAIVLDAFHLPFGIAGNQLWSQCRYFLGNEADVGLATVDPVVAHRAQRIQQRRVNIQILDVTFIAFAGRASRDLVQVVPAQCRGPGSAEAVNAHRSLHTQPVTGRVVDSIRSTTDDCASAG